MEIWLSVVKSSITTKFPVYLLTIGLPTELRRNNGAPSGIRTRDPLIKSQLLYQLS